MSFEKGLEEYTSIRRISCGDYRMENPRWYFSGSPRANSLE